MQTKQTAKIAELKREISALKKQNKSEVLKLQKELQAQNKIATFAVTKGLSLAHADIAMNAPAICSQIVKLLKGEILHPNGYSGSGRFIKKSTDRISYYKNILLAHSIPYTTGNDAPKGGWTGNFIRLKTEADFAAEREIAFNSLVERITPDEEYVQARIAAEELSGVPKNEAQQKCFSALLLRCGVTVDSGDYWRLFKTVKY